MDKFTKLLDTLSEIGYEADNEDCVELEFNDGNGAVTFINQLGTRPQLCRSLLDL